MSLTPEIQPQPVETPAPVQADTAPAATPVESDVNKHEPEEAVAEVKQAEVAVEPEVMDTLPDLAVESSSRISVGSGAQESSRMETEGFKAETEVVKSAIETGDGPPSLEREDVMEKSVPPTLEPAAPRLMHFGEGRLEAPQLSAETRTLEEKVLEDFSRDLSQSGEDLESSWGQGRKKGEGSSSWVEQVAKETGPVVRKATYRDLIQATASQELNVSSDSIGANSSSGMEGMSEQDGGNISVTMETSPQPVRSRDTTVAPPAFSPEPVPVHQPTPTPVARGKNTVTDILISPFSVIDVVIFRHK